MPLDQLPGKLIVLSRDQRKDKYLRDVQIRNPAALTGPGTEPFLDAAVFCDSTDHLVANALIIANGVTRATATGQALDDWAARMGTKRLDPVGGTGAVSVTLSAGGSMIFAGDIITHAPTGLRFQCTATATYLPGAQVPIAGLDTGFATNLPAGTVLSWQAPRPGCAQTATVILQADGSGLSNGGPQESDDDLRRRLDYIASNPPASGNDAQYQATVSTTQGMSVQQPFTYGCCKGPGSKGLTLTLRPAKAGANRIPNATQLALAAVNVQGQMPGDDGVYQITQVASPVVVVLKVLWAFSTANWTDATTWPPYLATPNLVVAGVPASGGLTPTNMRLSSASLTSATAPQVGQSIAFLDLANGVFRKKKILTVSAVSATTYDVTIDTSNGVSDTSYTPIATQACCPWSDSLNTLITPVLTYFDGLGPGEMFASFFDPGLRQRRSPPSPQYWPNVITNRLLGGAAAPVPASGAAQNLPPNPTLLTSPSLQDVVISEPTIPYVTPVGTPGVSVNLLTLGNLIIFPQ